MKALRCEMCGFSVFDYFYNKKGNPMCSMCRSELTEPEKVVVTRHKALVQYLFEQGVIDENVKVFEHATKEDIKGKNVIGVLPLSLACYANSITEVTMNLTKEMRGKELTLEDMRQVVGDLVTYEVIRHW